MAENGNGWKKYSEFVLRELKRIGGVQDKILENQVTIMTELAVMKWKCGFAGTLGASLPVIAFVLFQWWRAKP